MKFTLQRRTPATTEAPVGQNPGEQDIWAAQREYFAPSFRAEIGAIVGGGGGLGSVSVPPRVG